MSRKVTLTIEPDEAVVIGSLDQWRHLVELYNSMGDQADPDDSEYWYEAAQWIRSALNNRT